jgi:pyridoxine 4-dehydrogenase
MFKSETGSVACEAVEPPTPSRLLPADDQNTCEGIPTMTTSTPDRYALADKTVRRIGYGAMQLAAGDGFQPRDRDEALAVLREAVEAGVDHIDTAQYYGPGVVNELIREALFPYPEGLALVSKVGGRFDESDGIVLWDEPDQLRASIDENLATLGAEKLTAVNLRLLDNAVPDARFVDQLGALAKAREEGLIGGIGISNVSHAHLLRAVEVTDIVCVQNSYNLAYRSSQALLDDCIARGIAFVPFYPIGGQNHQREAILSNPVVSAIAARYDATHSQVALAWLLAIAPNVLLIPGTSSRHHLAENLGAASLSFEEDEVASLAEAFS